MDVRLAVPDVHVDADVIDPALEAITRLDEKQIARGEAPTFHDALHSKGGVRWQPEPPGAERFDSASTVARRGWGDCDDLAPWRAASMRHSGEDPGATARVYQSGPGRWHAVVQRSDGSIEDPSVEAGMRKHKGIAPAVVSPMLPVSVIGDDTACRPTIALRPNRRIGGFEARVDVPWDETLYAMSVLNRAPVASQSVVGAICGALLIGEDCGIACERTLQRLAAVGLLLDGHHPYDVIEETGLEAVVGAVPTLRAMAPTLGDTYYEVSDFVRRAVAPLTGPFRHQVEGEPASSSRMVGGETLTLLGNNTHKFLTSPNGRYRLVFQSDGNLVLYGPGAAPAGQWGPAIFSAQTNERGGSRLHMQVDGNLVIAGYDGKVKWASDTYGHPGSVLNVLDSGDATITDPKGALLWSAKRDGLHTYRRKEGDFSFSDVVDVVKDVAPILSKVVQFIPGVGPIASSAIDFGKGLISQAGPVAAQIVDIANKAIPLADQAKFVANSLVHAGIPIPATMPPAVHAAAAVSPMRGKTIRAAQAPAPAARAPIPATTTTAPAGIRAAPTAQVDFSRAAITDSNAPLFHPIPKSAGMIQLPGGQIILRF